MAYKDLTVWQKSIELTILVYSYTKKFPAHEQYGLTSQMRRAAVSIPSNIAEGSLRTDKEDHHFLRIAFSSGAELETQFEIARRLRYGEHERYQSCIELLDEVMRMLNTMVYKDSRRAHN